MVYRPPGLTPEVWAKIEANTRREEAVLNKAAESLSKKIGMDTAGMRAALQKIQWDFRSQLINTEMIEDAKKARRDLIKLAEKAEKLEAAILALGQGSIDAMNRQNIGQEFVLEADPSGLPDRYPTGPCPTQYSTAEEVRGILGHDDDELRGGRWVIRLHALSELARAQANQIAEESRKSGRKSFGTRLHGSPEDWLAGACKQFLKEHGCQTEAVIIDMWQRIKEAEYSKEALERKKDRERSKDKGRSAVRKKV